MIAMDTAKSSAKSKLRKSKSGSKGSAKSGAKIAAAGVAPWPELAANQLTDYLDAAGSRPNVFTGQPLDAAERANVLKDFPWNRFPMYKDGVRGFMSAFRDNNVVLLRSGTGSGKTVITPKLVSAYAMAAFGPDARVAVTNPKQVTTQENAVFSAKLAQVELGGRIGFNFRGAPPGSSGPDTVLEYDTDGYLLQRAKNDRDLSAYFCVIIDEVHERKVPTDFLMLAVRGALLRRPELRLVLMSATVDAAPFQRYFKSVGLSAALLDVSGEPNFPVTRVFRPLKPQQEYLEAAVDEVLAIISDPKAEPGGVLVFVPVKKDATRGCRMLQRACQNMGVGAECRFNDTELLCSPLYSNIPEATKAVALNRAPDGFRSVVFATNVAESSLTVKGLKYVVDTGLEFNNRFDADQNVQVTGKELVTLAQSTQRAGRVGRQEPGTAVLLYSEDAMRQMAPQPSPTLAVEDLTDQLFDMFTRLRTWSAVVQEAGQLLTPASQAQLDVARAAMLMTGCIGQHGDLTSAGGAVRDIAKMFRLGFDSAVLVLCGILFGAIKETCMVVSVREATKNDVKMLWLPTERDGDMVNEPPPAYKDMVAAHGSEHVALAHLKALAKDPKIAARLQPGTWKTVTESADNLERRATKFNVSRMEEVRASWPYGMINHGLQPTQALCASVLVSRLSRLLRGSDAGARRLACSSGTTRVFAIQSARLGDHNFASAELLSLSADKPDNPPAAEGVTVFLADKHLTDAFEAFLCANIAANAVQQDGPEQARATQAASAAAAAVEAAVAAAEAAVGRREDKREGAPRSAAESATKRSTAASPRPRSGRKSMPFA